MVMYCMVNGHDGDALFDYRVLYDHDGHPFSLRLMTGQAIVGVGWLLVQEDFTELK